jgi:hypothetical protein
MPISNTTIRQTLDYAILQSVAESYLHLVSTNDQNFSLERVVARGNNNPNNSGVTSGATGLTATQFEWFDANYEIVTHQENTASGFSATLFRRKGTFEYVMSFRSR